MDLGGKAISGELLHRLISRGIQFLRLAKASVSHNTVSSVLTLVIFGMTSLIHVQASSPNMMGLFQICGNYFPNPPPTISSRLHFLDLSMAETNDPIIVYEILSRCTELVAVSLENCFINDASCNALRRNSGLRILNLSSVHGLTHLGMQFIMAGCRSLEQLNVAWTKLDRETVAMMCVNAPESLARLNLAGCREDVLVDESKSQLGFLP